MSVVAKRALRSQLRRVLKSISAEQIASQSQQITGRVQSLVEQNNDHRPLNVACFLSMDSGEVDTKYILSWLFQNRHNVYLPRCTDTKQTDQVSLRSQDHPHLTFHHVLSQEDIDQWKPEGKYQLREPPLVVPAPKPPALDIMIVPGVAFDCKTGARMGWGAGYYDDFFQRYRHYNPNIKFPSLIGICLKEQCVDHIEMEKHDHHMDYVVVGDGTIHKCK